MIDFDIALFVVFLLTAPMACLGMLTLMGWLLSLVKKDVNHD